MTSNPTNVAAAGPMPGALVVESLKSARAHVLSASVLALVVTAVCVTTFLTAGRAVATEAAVLDRVDDAGTRTILVEDVKDAAELRPADLERVLRVSDVEWAIALGPIEDVRNSALLEASQPTGLRSIYGILPGHLRLEAGRWPGPGEVVVSLAAQGNLGLVSPSGAVSGGVRTWAVVGAFSADRPLSNLSGLVLAGADPEAIDAPIDQIIALASSSDAVESTATAIRAVLPAADPTALTVRTAEDLVSLRSALRGDLSAQGRTTGLLAIAAGAVLTALTVFSSSAARRRDFGRLRALGASRSALMVLVLLEAAASLVAGAIVGTISGLLLSNWLFDARPPLLFALSVPTLTIVAGMVAAVPAALRAARLDPVQVLRVP